MEPLKQKGRLATTTGTIASYSKIAINNKHVSTSSEHIHTTHLQITHIFGTYPIKARAGTSGKTTTTTAVGMHVELYSNVGRMGLISSNQPRFIDFTTA